MQLLVLDDKGFADRVIMGPPKSLDNVPDVARKQGQNHMLILVQSWIRT